MVFDGTAVLNMLLNAQLIITFACLVGILILGLMSIWGVKERSNIQTRQNSVEQEGNPQTDREAA